MHLLIASVSAATSPTGVCRHAANLARGIVACESVQKVTMFIGGWQADYFEKSLNLKHDKLHIRQVSISNNAVARNLWYLHALPEAARACGADIVHLAFPMPIRRSAGAALSIVSLHDLYPFDIPQNFGRRAWMNRAALKLCLRNADAVVCVSEETRTRAHELFPSMELGKARVVPNSVYLCGGIPHALLPEEIRNSPFLLCVAQHRANKNLPLLLRAFQRALDCSLVSPATRLALVGKEGPETKRLNQIAAQYGIEERTLFLNGISDALLSSLYRNCDLVIAPSLLEGFGLPVAEALAAGSRVVCSNIPAFRTIGADRCVFFDPMDSTGESLLSAMRQAIQTPCHATIYSAGLDPRQAGAMYMDIYSQLLFRERTTSSESRVIGLSASLPPASPSGPTIEERRLQ
jgi:glycosyltransferase involved in cell wall biosynthesis